MLARNPARTAAALALTLSGCAATIHDPARTNPLTTPRPTTATASTTRLDGGDPAPERGGTIAPAAHRAQTTVTAAAGARTPQEAIARYLALWANWTATDVIARQHKLAAISLGQARDQALQAATTLAGDSTLLHSQVTNTGRLIALAPGQGTATGQWVVVSQERTTGQGTYAGLPPTVHVIYAQLTHTHDGWVVTAWQPQD